MVSLIRWVIGLVGATCALVPLLIGSIALGTTFSERMPGKHPGASEEKRNARIGSLLLILGAVMAALVTKRILGLVS